MTEECVIILSNNLHRFEESILSYLLDKEEGILSGTDL